MREYLYKIRLILAILVVIAAIAGVLFFIYPVKIFNFQVIPFLQRLIIDFSTGAIIAALIVTVQTLILGRIFCSLCCPLGILQELISLITNKDYEKRQNFPLKYFIFAISVGMLIGGTAIAIRYIDPYTIFSSSLTLSVIGIISLILIAIAAFFKGRVFCTYICPAGVILGLLSKFSILKMYIDKKECISCSMCERNCQTGCISIDEQEIDNENCIKCLKCLEVCPKEAIHYGLKPMPDIKFSEKIRKIIISAAFLAVFGAAIKAGIEVSKNTVQKISGIILPPLAETPERFLNKCLNCNLCVKACPNKIIKKSDKNFGAVHIEYGEKGFCDNTCNKCSQVCPSGALKKITLEQKQHTRIAMAVINKENCDKCKSCIPVCPRGAIFEDEQGDTIVNSIKCIGCGLCKSTCKNNAIEISGVNEQRTV